MKVVIVANHYHDRYGVEHERGDEAEYNDQLASKLIRHGIAKPAPKKAVPVVETSEKAPPENTAKRTAKPRARKGPR